LVLTASRPRWSTAGGLWGRRNPLRGGVGGVADLLPASTYIHRSAAFRKTGGKGITYPLLGDGHIAARLKTSIRELADAVNREMS
jgi:hypothetical protein